MAKSEGNATFINGLSAKDQEMVDTIQNMAIALMHSPNMKVRKVAGKIASQITKLSEGE